MTIRLRAVRVAAAAGALLLGGCDASERAARAEAADISRAVDAVRAADNPAKAGPLAALRDKSCSVADICAVKSLCIAAYEQHERALALVAEAKAGITAAPAASVAQTLTLAESALTRAKSQTDDCATRQGEMARHFKVAR
ncbi:MAG TPA: hypothetical protein VGQ57_11085 [Polyangiaceae bacterium]|nr:hypothetical protein [Polyangiaceae bacterium]